MRKIETSGLKRSMIPLVAALSIPATVSAYTEFRSDGVSYEITDPVNCIVRTSPGILYESKYLPGSYIANELRLSGIVGYEGKFYTLTDIAHNSFCNNPAMTGVVIRAERLKEIGIGAFEDCPVLRKVAIETSTDYTLGIQAFRNCPNLRNADLGLNVTSIGTSAFWNCQKLEEFHVPSKVTFIGDYAFQYCYGLKNLFFSTTVLPEIGVKSFAYCESLVSLKLPSTGLTRIGDSAFCGCNSLESLEIPNSVTKIEGHAFSGCHALTTLSLGTGVETIGEGAFGECFSLEKLEFGPDLRVIGDHAFRYCYKVKEVDLPASVVQVGEFSLYGDIGVAMDRVICRATVPPAAGQWIFNPATYEKAVLYVPAASVNSYAAHPEWGKFNKIRDINSMNAGIETVTDDNDTDKGSGKQEEIYTLDGRRSLIPIEDLLPGIYILRSGSNARKILVN